MSKVKAILGYTLASLSVPVLLATFFGLASWMNLLVAGTGLTISPWYSGGPVARTIDHATYQTRIHQPVFQALLGERREGFVQIAWSPREAVPELIDEEVDYNGDGQADFRIQLEKQTRQASLMPYSPQVIGLQGVYCLKEAWAIRASLKK